MYRQCTFLVMCQTEAPSIICYCCIELVSETRMVIVHEYA